MINLTLDTLRESVLNEPKNCYLMETTAIALAYCIDNLPIAEGIEKALAPTNYSFSHHYCKKAGNNQPIADQLQHHDGPILLLVSDNFLKSLSCMEKALRFIQTKNRQIIPVVVNGRKMDEASGQYVDVTTKFQKIGDIIPYINYWQNQYLDLRAQRKSIEAASDFDKESFSEHLRVLRQVSSEASEFLRVLRNMPHYEFEEFTDNHFEVLFDFLEDEEAWEALQTIAPNLAVDTTPNVDLEETDASQEEDISTSEEVDEAEDFDIDLTEIPGIEFLEGSENIAKIIQNRRSEEQPEPLSLPDEEEEEALINEEVEPEEPSEVPTPDKEHHLFDDFEEEIEDDIYEELLEERAGGPASEKDEIEEEHAEDSDPAPEVFVPEEKEPEEEIEEEEEADALEDDFDEELVSSEHPADQFVASKTGFVEDTELTLEETIEEDIPPAEDLDEELTEEEEEKVKELLEQAFSLMNAGQLEDAFTYMEQATVRFPNSTDIKYHYALMLAQNTSDFDSATAQLQDLLAIDKEHLEANFLLGELMEIQENYPEAQAYYEQVTQIEPSFQNVYARLGTIALAQSDPDKKKVMKYFKRALKINKKHVDAHYQYALLVNEFKGDSKKAIKYLKKTVDLNPGHPFANYDLALLYFQMGNKEDARTYYLKACEINPELKTMENDLAFGNVMKNKKRKKPKKAFNKEKSAAKPIIQAEKDRLEELEPSLEVDKADDLQLGLSEDQVSATPIDEKEEEIHSSSHEEFAELQEKINTLEQLLSEKEALEKQQPRINKTVFITGASSGIGRATARIFAANGYRLIINGRRQERLLDLKEELTSAYGTELILLPFDVSKNEEVELAVASLPTEWKSIDVLVNNAGKAKGFSPIHEGDLVHWEEMIDVNLKGLLYLTRVVTPGMVERQSGHVINVCSTAGKEVYPNGNVYCATKYAVDALTKAMRIDLHKYDIRVSQVAPGHVEETEFAVVRFDGDTERAKIYDDFNPLTSSDVAETIYFIASQPDHVNIQDVLMMGTQQAGSNFINRSGRQEEEE